MNAKNIFKGKNARYWLIGSVVVIVALFLLLRFNPASASDAAIDMTAEVTSVNVAETVNASGSLEAQPFASLIWETGGVVEEVYVKAGDHVKAGDVLMKLKTSSVPASVISARADLATAQKDLDDLLNSSNEDFAQTVIDLRSAQLAYDRAVNYVQFLERSRTTQQTQAKLFIESVNRGGKKYVYKTKVFKDPAPEDWFIEAGNDVALKKAQLEDAQRAYDRLKDGANAQDVTAAQARIDAAQAKVDSMSIIAPFDGQVLFVESQPDDVVTTDSVALNMANLDHLYIETQISESEITSVRVGNPIMATVEAVPGLKLAGQVAAISALGEVDSSGSVQYTLRIDIDQVAEDTFLPLGSTANVTIQTKEAAPSLAVPITVIQNDSQGEYVLVVQPDGSAKRVDVSSGTIVGDLVTVSGDLKEGDILTIASKSNLPQGMFGGRN
ncbi:MAG TPA: efflux RND transporter periplasmic adaptor subunit [Anaerolineales bacterium]|nr:efflux RND transporter periplasmic adaptor subunit [Anaerolineales bacterium]